MATKSGKDGKIMIGGTTLADITGWTLNRRSNNPSYASSATAGHKTRREGVKDYSGSFTFKLDVADPITGDITEGTTYTLLLYLDGSLFWSCPVIIDSIAHECDINDGEVLGGTCEFSATAAPTKPSGF